MALFLAMQVIKGAIEFDEVPVVLQPEVSEILIDAGFGDLCA